MNTENKNAKIYFEIKEFCMKNIYQILLIVCLGIVGLVGCDRHQDKIQSSKKEATIKNNQTIAKGEKSVEPLANQTLDNPVGVEKDEKDNEPTESSKITEEEKIDSAQKAREREVQNEIIFEAEKKISDAKHDAQREAEDED